MFLGPAVDMGKRLAKEPEIEHLDPLDRCNEPLVAGMDPRTRQAGNRRHRSCNIHSRRSGEGEARVEADGGLRV